MNYQYKYKKYKTLYKKLGGVKACKDNTTINECCNQSGCNPWGVKDNTMKRCQNYSQHDNSRRRCNSNTLGHCRGFKNRPCPDHCMERKRGNNTYCYPKRATETFKRLCGYFYYFVSELYDKETNVIDNINNKYLVNGKLDEHLIDNQEYRQLTTFINENRDNDKLTLKIFTTKLKILPLYLNEFVKEGEKPNNHVLAKKTILRELLLNKELLPGNIKNPNHDYDLINDYPELLQVPKYLDKLLEKIGGISSILIFKTLKQINKDFNFHVCPKSKCPDSNDALAIYNYNQDRAFYLLPLVSIENNIKYQDIDNLEQKQFNILLKTVIDYSYEY